MINHIPHEFLEPEVISIAVRKDYRSFDKLSGLKITPRVMLHMLLVDPRVAEFMPQRLLDDATFRKKAELIGNGWERFAPAKDVQPA